MSKRFAIIGAGMSGASDGHQSSKQRGVRDFAIYEGRRVGRYLAGQHLSRPVADVLCLFLQLKADWSHASPQARGSGDISRVWRRKYGHSTATSLQQRIVRAGIATGAGISIKGGATDVSWISSSVCHRVLHHPAIPTSARRL